MNVFVLSTGRCGSKTFAKACSHITNFSAGHESNTGRIGPGRFEYPQWHIETDNRLSWMLGDMEQRYGKAAFYVHLRRSESAVAESYNRRWRHPESLVLNFARGILSLRDRRLTEVERRQASEMLCTTVNNNISSFLRDKEQKLEIQMESWEETLPVFWEKIGAKGDITLALQELRNVTNTSQDYDQNIRSQYWYNRWRRRFWRFIRGEMRT